MNQQEEQKQLLIPDNIKVGYKPRPDTYNGKLAFITYKDHKGQLKKEKTWEGWRDKQIEPDDFKNEPTEGFVLNKGVGGVRESSGWNARNEYIRVYDPRGFEFEISVANLLFILREGTCHPGKGLEGKFVYGWDGLHGTSLVLLPVSSQDYQNCIDYTNLQSKKVGIRDLVPGAVYTTRKQDVLVYLGKFDYNYMLSSKASRYHAYNDYKDDTGTYNNIFVFWNNKKNDFVCLKNIKSLSVRNGNDIVSSYPDLVNKYLNSHRASKIVRLFLDETTVGTRLFSHPNSSQPWHDYQSEIWYYGHNGSFYKCRQVTKNEKEELIFKDGEWINSLEGNDSIMVERFYIENGFLIGEHCRGEKPPISKTNYSLFAELESGEKVLVDNLASRYNIYGNIFVKDI